MYFEKKSVIIQTKRKAYILSKKKAYKTISKKIKIPDGTVSTKIHCSVILGGMDDFQNKILFLTFVDLICNCFLNIINYNTRATVIYIDRNYIIDEDISRFTSSIKLELNLLSIIVILTILLLRKIYERISKRRKISKYNFNGN